MSELSPTLAQIFKLEMSDFLEQLGITRAVWTEIPGKTPEEAVAYELLIPKAHASGFDVSFEAYDFGIYPSVEELELAPLDAMVNFEIEWSKRFLFSALSSEASLTVQSRRGVAFRRTLSYYDAWTEEREECADPKWFYNFWSRSETKVFQNLDLEISQYLVQPSAALT